MQPARTFAAVALAALGSAAILAAAGAQSPGVGTPPDDRAVSVGRWNVVAVESNGKPVDPELVAMLRVEYRADGTWAVLFKNLPVAEGRSTNRQDLSPKTFEMETLGSPSIEPTRYTGIYRQEGDTRVLCFVPAGKPRPDAFTAPRRSARTLVTLERAADP